MNKLTRQQIEQIREDYPPGTRIELINMEDDYSVPPGTRGTVDLVDGLGQLQMTWDNGRALAVVPELDSFRKLSQLEIQEEQQWQTM